MFTEPGQEEPSYRYPWRTRVNNAFSVLFYVWFFLTGLYFLAAHLPDTTQGRIGMAFFVSLFGVGAFLTTRRQLRLHSVIRLSDSGIHLWRGSDEVMVISWTEIRAVKSKSRFGDFEVQTDSREKRLRVERRLVGLDELRSFVERRWSAIR